MAKTKPKMKIPELLSGVEVVDTVDIGYKNIRYKNITVIRT